MLKKKKENEKIRSRRMYVQTIFILRRVYVHKEPAKFVLDVFIIVISCNFASAKQ